MTINSPSIPHGCCDECLYFYESHLSSRLQLPTSKQTPSWVQKVLQFPGYVGGKRGGSPEGSKGHHCAVLPNRPWPLVPGGSRASPFTRLYEMGKTWGLCFLPALTPLCVAHEQARCVSPRQVHPLLCRGPRPTCSSNFGPMIAFRLPSDLDRCWKPSRFWDDQGRAFPGLQTA